jgi:histidine triad (HIT) family protein
MNCLFCDIAEGKVAADLVYDDPLAVAFLDHRPLFPGHVLLIPRKHVITLADLPGEDVGAFFQTAQRLEGAVERAMEADGSFVAINNRVSQSVSHLHVHIVPRRKKDGLKGFFWPRTKYQDDEHRRDTAKRIRAVL